MEWKGDDMIWSELLGRIGLLWFRPGMFCLFGMIRAGIGLFVCLFVCLGLFWDFIPVSYRYSVVLEHIHVHFPYSFPLLKVE